MNRFVLSTLALIVVLAGVQTGWAADAGIPGSFKSLADPSSHRGEIADKVKEQIAKLGNDAEPAAQTAARDWLQNEAAQGNAGATSAGYLDLYSDVLNKQLEQLMKSPEASARAKVNAVLIAGKVSETSGTANLLPTILAGLGDKNEAIVMLAEKSAGQILPGVFNNLSTNADQGKKALLDAIVKAVKDHTNSSRAGPIVEGAYGALNPTLRTNVAVAPATDGALADAVLQLQKDRLKLYKTGIPDSPDADARGALFLLDQNRWNVLSKAQKLAAAQNTSDLLWCAAQRASQLAANENRNFIDALDNMGTMLQSLAHNNLHNDALEQVSQAVAKLSIGTEGKTVLEVCKPVYVALQASSPDFKDLKAPPELPPLVKPVKS